VKTLTMKLPEPLLAWLEDESKRLKLPKSALVRQILQKQEQAQPRNALAMAADLCGCAQSGLGDLARNRKRLKGFGR
jgi:hypothetical protein